MQGSQQVKINLQGLDLEVYGFYTPKIEDQPYTSAGEPGTPGEPAEFELQSISWPGHSDLIRLIEVMDSIRDVQGEIENLCIETFE
jgi:hypothetical protein